MRIIAGLHKGRKLYTPKDQAVRPTSDKVKEALFSMVEANLPGMVVVDLFAGSGGLGLEALSRGAKKCYFCDSSRESIHLVRRNVSLCKEEDRAVVGQRDFKTFLSELPEPADLIFMDPPYGELLWEEAVALIQGNNLLKEDGLLVLEHPREVDFPLDFHGYTKIKERRYGTVVLSIFIC